MTSPLPPGTGGDGVYLNGHDDDGCRILEVVRIKCGDREAEIWPYMLQELSHTLSELGIPTPHHLGYEQPELALPNPYEMH